MIEISNTFESSDVDLYKGVDLCRGVIPLSHDIMIFNLYNIDLIEQFRCLISSQAPPSKQHGSQCFYTVLT